MQSVVTAFAGILFFIVAFIVVVDPAVDSTLNTQKQGQFLRLMKAGHAFPDFQFDLRYMNPYARLNFVLADLIMQKEHEATVKALPPGYKQPYTMHALKKKEEAQKTSSVDRCYVEEKERWLDLEKKKISFILYPLFRLYHWEDDAGGDQAMNRVLPFYALSRTSRQDLMSALIYGARISLFVGIVSTALALLIGVPLGLISGYVGGRLDIVLCRFIEVWEAMPAFFMLLMIVTILETKSIFLVIAVIALFNWTQAFRFVRAETFRQREMAYIEAALSLGFPWSRIIFSHLLPNCIVPVIALLPFDIMAAITREAGLAFLGLGEEHSCSWGVLMDEGREAFPQESALLWPPAVALTILLMAIAFVGNALQTALDPKAK